MRFQKTIPIKTNHDERTLAVGANIQFTEDEKVFLVAEAFCHYEIENSCWEELSDRSSKDVLLPKKARVLLSQEHAGPEDSPETTMTALLRRYGEARPALVAKPRAGVALPSAQGAAPHVAALRGGECEVLEECGEGEADIWVTLFVN